MKARVNWGRFWKVIGFEVVWGYATILAAWRSQEVHPFHYSVIVGATILIVGAILLAIVWFTFRVLPRELAEMWRGLVRWLEVRE